ncbi:hypothetical protein V2J09_005963 [Rumex salicifolius]
MEDDDRAAGGHYATLLPSSESGRLRLRARVRWAVKAACWAVFVVWGLLMALFPLGVVQDVVQDWISLTQDATLFGATGSFMVAFSGPILLIALLAALYLNLSDDEDESQHRYLRKKKKSEGPRYSLWTFPAVVEGPFGVLSAAELIAILTFTAAVIFSSSVLETWGSHVGMIGLFCLAFLFIPVSRGSVLLRLVDIPFEQAARYHVWLGHLTMFVFTLHGMSYVLFSWDEMDSIAILPGVIALLCGLLMWATALHLVRREYFELFFYTHYLYIGFVIFFALHVGDFIFSVVLGGILIFMLDRFLRFWQSRKTVDIISYNALSMIFVNVGELSLLQWHPFSVSSSPMEGGNHVAVLAKVLGDWTMKLDRRVSSVCHGDEDCEEGNSTQLCQTRIPLAVSIEGPYGHETPYFLMYKNLVLVAGGIGISPFLAIMKDLLYRIKEGRRIFPNTVLLIWAIKTSDELSLLPDLDSICPSFFDLLNVEIQVFVTRQSSLTPVEEGKTYKKWSTSIYKNTKQSGISVLVGTGDNKWSSIYASLSIVGFIVILALVDEYLVNPYDLSNEWYIGLVLLACMVASVVVVGGLLVVSWYVSERKTPILSEEHDDRNGESVTNMLHQHNGEDEKKTFSVHYGCRPMFEEIFESMEDNWGSIDVGVIVCGPSSLEKNVAKEIRSRSLRRRSTHPIFHFHSHSFEL